MPTDEERQQTINAIDRNFITPMRLGHLGKLHFGDDVCFKKLIDDHRDIQHAYDASRQQKNNQARDAAMARVAPLEALLKQILLDEILYTIRRFTEVYTQDAVKTALTNLPQAKRPLDSISRTLRAQAEEFPKELPSLRLSKDKDAMLKLLDDYRFMEQTLNIPLR
ncbi:hypothetical protein BD410DRAFT_888640 [Rickenella mellea]|uniref:Uncharacterized protein n=1 Tax=Rickenella mellea TaxID=50990 RepID=A0A4Y7PPK7_9AGAM|nr:hypothetical protein BD410DRAFT_888640 [Rickenella mellea]